MKYQRTQIYLEPEDHRKLCEEARRRGVSLAALLREVVGSHLREQSVPSGPPSFDAIVGVADLPSATDVARDEVAYRDEALAARYRKKVTGAQP